MRISPLIAAIALVTTAACGSVEETIPPPTAEGPLTPHCIPFYERPIKPDTVFHDSTCVDPVATVVTEPDQDGNFTIKTAGGEEQQVNVEALKRPIGELQAFYINTKEPQ